MEREREERSTGCSLRSRKIRASPADVGNKRAGESCLDQKQKRAGFRKGMRMVTEQNPGAGEGLRVGL